MAACVLGCTAVTDLRDLSTGSIAADPGATASSSSTGGSGRASSSTGGSGGGTSASSGSGAGGATVVLDTATGIGPGGPCELILDDSNVYWASGDQLRRVPKSGGAGSVVTTLGGLGGLAQDETYLYWTTYGEGTVLRVPKAGGAEPTLLASGLTAPEQVMVDGATLYWIDITEMLAMPVQGQATPAVLSSDAYGHSAVASDADNLYWGTNEGVLVAREKLSPNQVELAGEVPTTIRLDGTNVYFSSWDPGNSTISRVLIDGTSPSPSSVATGATGAFAMDADELYYIMSFEFTSSGHDELVRVAKEGGTAVSMSEIEYSTSPDYRCIAADDSYVFWVDGPNLLRYAK